MEKLLPYFSFRGRTNRQRYWLTTLAFYGALLVIGLVASIVPVAGMILAGVAVVPLLWIALALAVRRLHDRSKSAWWLLLMAVPPAFLSSLADVGARTGSGVEILFNALALPFTIWMFVELGCLRGTRGSNRFGPDPLEPTPAEVFA